MIDPVLEGDRLRRLREMLRGFLPRPPLRKMATDFGFRTHASLYLNAARYEASRGLRPDEREVIGGGSEPSPTKAPETATP